MLGRIADLKASLSADETMRVLYSTDFRGKSKIAGKVVYIGLARLGRRLRLLCLRSERRGVPLLRSQGRRTAPCRIAWRRGAVSVSGTLAPIKGAP